MAVKQFYEPHPGLMGCTTPIPESVRLIAEQLDGEYHLVEEVIQMLQDVAPDDCLVKDCPSHNMITMSGGKDIRIRENFSLKENGWRVLFYR